MLKRLYLEVLFELVILKLQRTQDGLHNNSGMNLWIAGVTKSWDNFQGFMFIFCLYMFWK